MNQPLSSHDLGSDVLKRVKEGMDVYDRYEHKIGTVELVYFGEVDEQTDALGKGPETAGTPPQEVPGNWLVNTGRGFDFDEDLPDVARARLLRSGFLEIDTGLFTSDLYVMPDHIASVRDKKVYLSVDREGLSYK